MTQRTPQQNKSLHKLFSMYAEQLNDAGYDQKAILEKKVLPTPNTMESIKGIFKAVQAAMYPTDGKISTTDLDTKQIQQVYIVLDKFIAENFGISIEWPHEPDKP